jgi:hypothetical protein
MNPKKKWATYNLAFLKAALIIPQRIVKQAEENKDLWGEASRKAILVGGESSTDTRYSTGFRCYCKISTGVGDIRVGLSTGNIGIGCGYTTTEGYQLLLDNSATFTRYGGVVACGDF